MTVDKAEGSRRLDHALRVACLAARSDHPALVDEDETITFAELEAESVSIAGLLSAAGIETNEPVLVPVSNRARDLMAFFAVWRAGAVVVPIHRRTPAPEADRLMKRTGVRFVLNLRTDIHVADNVAAEHAVKRLCPEWCSVPDILRDAAWLNFTSGSTGEPKGVVHGHDSYLGKLEMIDGMLGYSDHERVLLVLQLSFSFAQWVSLLTLVRGGTVVLQEKFRAERFLDALDADVTRVAVVPTMIRSLKSRWVASEESAFAGTIMAGGETMEAALGEWIRDRWPRARLWDIYGLTETATCDFFVRPEEREIAAGTIGRPGPGIHHRIVGPDGELQIRSPYVMRGYFDAPELTQDAFEDGFFRTGDLARELPTGHVQLVGRRKDMVSRGGINVSPLEVEQLFLGHGGIAAALATGIPDAIKGETLHIMVVPNPGAVITEASLLEWAREQMSRDKIPDAVHVASALPEGSTGKADRNALREALTRRGRMHAS